MGTLRWYALSTLCLAVLLCVGCTNADVVAMKTRQIAELRFEKARVRESLSELITEVEHVKRKLAAVDAEKSSAIQGREELSEQLRFANEQITASKREQEKIAISLEDVEARSSLLEQSLEKVKSIASSSAIELVDLRLKSHAFDKQLATLRSDNVKLRKERIQLSSMTTDLQEELKKSQAVVRSIRAGAEDTDRFRELEKELGRLYKENADLRGEKLALDKRVANVESREAELSQLLAKSSIAEGERGAPISIEEVKSELVYENDPQGLAEEVGGFVTARYKNWLNGTFDVDTFDISAIVFGSLVLVALVGFLVRSRKIRRLKNDLQDLRDELEEFESVEVAREVAVEERARRDAALRTPRVPGSLPRSGLSAVISSRGATPVQEEIQEEPEPPRDKVPPKPSGPVVGTLSGAASASEVSEGEDELANTQLIPGGFEEERATETLSSPSVDTEPLDRQESSSKGEDELLSELKAVINKKFDEIV